MESIRRQEQRLEKATQIQNYDNETVYFSYTTAKEYSRLGEYDPPSFYVLVVSQCRYISPKYQLRMNSYG